MSLINDALKNAHKKADQPRQSPVDGLTLRPPEPSHPGRRNGWLIPALVGLGFALAAIAAVNFYLNRNSNSASPENLTVNAREAAPASDPVESTPRNPAPAEPVKGPAPVTPKTLDSPKTTTAQTVVPVHSAPPVTAAARTSATLSPDNTAVTQPAPVATVGTEAGAAPVAPPQPEPLRLQAIVYHPTRPSALISGKTVFVGERVQGMKVVGITKETATVAGNGKNLVLKLPE